METNPEGVEQLELPLEPPAPKSPTLPAQQQTDILYSYSVLMMVGGEVRILKSEHIAAVREPATSDIIMTSRYIHDTLRSNTDGSNGSAPVTP